MNANKKILKQTDKPKRVGGVSHKVPKKRISEVHELRARSGLGCKNCIYANFCAAQPTLRAYVNGIVKKDTSELLYNENWRI